MDAAEELGDRDLSARRWRSGIVPGTAASALRAAEAGGAGLERDFDRRAFVYRLRFSLDEPPQHAALAFDGLATHAEVFLNGTPVLSARNMFRRYVADADGLLARQNELLVHFRALAPELARKRPAGRWPTRLVTHRNLRYVRTTLLGRTRGAMPSCAPVGPWRGIRLIERERVRLHRVQISTDFDAGDGVLAVTVGGTVVSGAAPTVLELRIAGALERAPISVSADGAFEASIRARVRGAKPWWPNGLGEPRLYRLSLALGFGPECLELGSIRVGFRRIERDTGNCGGFDLRINGRATFWRGACWMPVDPIGLGEEAVQTRHAIALARDAGMNMLRVNGITFYESEPFYDACDELGILVWQDFMLARMDYPEEDPSFVEEIEREAEDVLARLHSHPSLAVLCGNTEVEQQAAMMGLAPERARSALFERVLPAVVRRWCGTLPYLPSSPSGGALPFHADAPVSHYFGVGAYSRAPEDARLAGVRFASACLAFSNVPEDAALEELFGDESWSVHSPRYKEGVPRDPGAGWDFADVTDHYLEALFGCDARLLRYSEGERYLALARVVPGELMERTLGYWRAGGSGCRGALIWALRDLWPGSGWGILDSAGRPKAVYWFLKRVCAPRALWMTDEGLNGLRVHVANDAPEPFAGRLRLRLVRGDGTPSAHCEHRLDLPGGVVRAFSCDALIGRFSDANYAYRFGPLEHAIVVADVLDERGCVVATASHLPGGLPRESQNDLGLRARAVARGDGSYQLHIATRALATFVRIEVPGFMPSDNYFHLAPLGERIVALEPVTSVGGRRGAVCALNTRSRAAVVFEEPAA